MAFPHCEISFIQTMVIYFYGYVFAVLAGHYSVRAILKSCPLSDASSTDAGLKRAGAVIGIIERIFIMTFVLLGQYTAIAFVFAAKSIVRFGEAKERKFAEYYLIGTMASILFALLTGIATAYLRKCF
jgi:hypothetical protein